MATVGVKGLRYLSPYQCMVCSFQSLLETLVSEVFGIAIISALSVV